MESPLTATCDRRVLLLLLSLAAGCRLPARSGPAPSAAPTVAQAPVIQAQAPEALNGGVVAVMSEGQGYDYTSPWAKQRPWSRRTSGLVVDDKHILVAGGLLANSTLIEVQKRGQPQRYPAKIAIADWELPLALLEVSDAHFFDDLSPLPIAAEAPSSGQVDIARWLGSGQFETAEGKLRQVTVQDHFPGRTSLLSLDVSTAIESAGASEVVVAGDEVIGLATSKSENQLRVISGPVLRQFLERSAKRPYVGFPRTGFNWEPMTNPALRRFLGVPNGAGGVLIRSMPSHGSAAGVLQDGDVLLELAGHAIDESGKFDHPRYGKLYFGVLFAEEHAPGESLSATILRGKKPLQVALPLRRMDPNEDVVPAYIYDQAPEYLVAGGLVIQYLSRPFLETWRDWWKTAPLRLLVANDREGPFPSKDKKRIVIISRVLPDPVNLGYEDLEPVILEQVNGKPARNLAEVKAALDHPLGNFDVLEMAPGQSTSRIVLDAAEVAASDARVRALYRIPAASSRP